MKVPKKDLNNNNTNRYANVERGNLIGPNPYAKNHSQLMTTEGELASPGISPIIGCSKRSVQKSQLADSIDSIYKSVYICVCVYVCVCLCVCVCKKKKRPSL